MIKQLSKYISLPMAALMMTGCASSERSPAPEAVSDSFSFVVISDIPYGEGDRAFMRRTIPAVKEAAPPFVVHLGDYKGGDEFCLSVFDAFHQDVVIDGLAPIPLFYTPGDNEWTDCDKFKDPDTGLIDSPLSRLRTIRSLYFGQTSQSTRDLGGMSQDKLIENSTWTYGDVRFLTLHVPGTNNGRDYVTGDPLEEALDEVTKRDAANREWLAQGFAKAKAENASAVIIGFQADVTRVQKKPQDVMCSTVSRDENHPCDAYTDLRADIQRLSIDFDRPVLVMHGDTRKYTLDQTFAGEEAPNLWRLNSTGDGIREIVTVTVSPSADIPFSAVGFTTGTPAGVSE